MPKFGTSPPDGAPSRPIGNVHGSDPHRKQVFRERQTPLGGSDDEFILSPSSTASEAVTPRVFKRPLQRSASKGSVSSSSASAVRLRPAPQRRLQSRQCAKSSEGTTNKPSDLQTGNYGILRAMAQSMTRIEKMMFEHHVPNDLLSPKGMDDRAFAPSFLHQTHYSQDVPSQPTARQSFPKHNDMQTLDDWPPHPKDDSSDGTSTPTPRKQPEQTSEEPLLAQTEFITFLPAAALGLELDLLAIIKHSWARLRRLLARPDLNTLNPSKLLSVKQGLVLHSRELIQVIKHRVQDNSELIQGEAQRRRMGEICSQPMGVMIGNLEDDERGLLRILGEMEYGELVELLRKRKH